MVQEPQTDEPGIDEPPILVPVDLSAHSEAALVFASDLAGRYGAPLVVLHVVHDSDTAPGYYFAELARDGDDEPVRPIEQAAEIVFAKWMTGVLARYPDDAVLHAARTRLVVGVPTGRILEVAADEGARMIVMGSHGRTGLPYVMLGSKAQRVAHLSRIPVTIVKAEAEADE